MMLRVAIYLCLVAGALALKSRVGRCPDIPRQELNLQKLLGKWLTYERSYDGADMSSKCQGFEVLPQQSNPLRIVFFDFSTILNRTTTILAEGEINDNIVSATMHVPAFGISEKEFRILETDYLNYGIIVSCEEFGNQHLLQFYINTRVANPKINTAQIVKKAFKRMGIKPLQMIKVDQSECPEWLLLS